MSFLRSSMATTACHIAVDHFEVELHCTALGAGRCYRANDVMYELINKSRIPDTKRARDADQEAFFA